MVAGTVVVGAVVVGTVAAAGTAGANGAGTSDAIGSGEAGATVNSAQAPAPVWSRRRCRARQRALTESLSAAALAIAPLPSATPASSHHVVLSFMSTTILDQPLYAQCGDRVKGGRASVWLHDGVSPRLGSYVRRWRLRAGLTQQQAAELAGMSLAALRDLEQGRVVAPRPAALRRLGGALWFPASEFEELIRRGQSGQLPAESLWIQVLGPLRVRVRGASVEIGSTRSRLLLASLALAVNTPVSQEQLVERIWGNQPPVNATERLRVDASRLRRRLRPALTDGGVPDLAGTPAGYQLTVSANQLDLLLFGRLVDQARAARQEGDPDRARRLLAEAMTLWRGDPLTDLTELRGDPAVVELSRRWQAAVVDYAQVATALGRPDEVIPWLRRVVKADPLHEAASAALLVALATAGRADLASSLFKRLRRRLAEELGTDPGPELRQAQQTVLRRGGAVRRLPTVVARARLPNDLAEFTGRGRELEWLQERAAQSVGSGRTASTMMSIVGPGGVGKTTLAIHFAHRLLRAGHHADVLIYIDLGETPAEAALTVMLTTLGVPLHELPSDRASLVAHYRDRLAGQAALLLLDNVYDEDQVVPLLPAGPRHLVLITARRVLALDGADLLTLDAFPPADAEQLLARVAGADRVTRDRIGSRRLVARCGHLPLAVELAGRRLRARPTWRPTDLADRLDRAPDPLRELAADTDLLRAVFDRSLRTLPESERELFRSLGTLPIEETTVAAAARLAGAPPARARRWLDRLADEHLLVALPGDRYRLTGLLRVYAQTLPESAALGGGREVGELNQLRPAGPGDQPPPARG